jgi:hypothetical protein
MKLILALTLLLTLSNTEASLTQAKSADDVAALIDTLSYLNYSPDEMNECIRIDERARALINEEGYETNRDEHKERYEEVYKLFKQAICGTGESEYSKIYTKFVEERIDTFCSQEHIDMETIARFKKSFDMVIHYNIWYQLSPIAYHLSLVADGEQNVEKVIRLRKEVIFWYALRLLFTPYSKELRGAIIIEMKEVCRLQKNK